jgi:hypothetical protein
MENRPFMPSGPPIEIDDEAALAKAERLAEQAGLSVQDFLVQALDRYILRENGMLN